MSPTLRYEFSQDIPLLHEADVIVVGGGPGGIGAAVMAARGGAKTLLIERYGFLGGMASAGEVHPFMPNHAGGKCLDRPVYVEWARAMRKYVAAGSLSEELATREDRAISKDAAMLAAEDLCLDAGVKLLYHHTLADAVVRDGKIDALVAQLIKAQPRQRQSHVDARTLRATIKGTLPDNLFEKVLQGRWEKRS